MTKPHNPNCAIVRQGNTRAWCDCGVDNQTPPDWVLIEAAERSNFAYSLNFIANKYADWIEEGEHLK